MTVSWKPWLWRTLITAAIFTIIAAGFYAEENARGVRAWQQCEQKLAAKGESLDWKRCVPPPVPDDRNFYAAPSMVEWFIKGASLTTYSAKLGNGNPETTKEVTDELSASNYLAWNSSFEPDYQLIRDALKRPDARINGDYSRPFLQPVPNFVNYRVVCQVFAHRAKCHLFLGQPEKALEDLAFLHDLIMTLVKNGTPSLLVTSMIHTAMVGTYADAVTYGLTSHAWHEPQLTALEQQLADFNLVPVVADSLRHERAATCEAIDNTSIKNFISRNPASTKSTPSDLGWDLIPAGWVYQNKALIVTLEQGTLDCIDTTNRQVSPHKLTLANLNVENAFRHGTPLNFMAAMCIPNFTKATETMARNQTWADQSRIVCALERFYLATGSYPGALTNLVPKYIDRIPHDIINGSPMSYSSADGHSFKLYSVGWNEVDDGGVTIYDSGGTERRDLGDWVWSSPK